MKQLTIFGDVEQPVKKRRNGGSQNPIVFRDYESFIAKFSDHPRTTDECWTPQDVYEAVVDYVGTLVDMTDRLVLRPFYPGGDYINAEYPMGGGSHRQPALLDIQQDRALLLRERHPLLFVWAWPHDYAMRRALHVGARLDRHHLQQWRKSAEQLRHQPHA